MREIKAGGWIRTYSDTFRGCDEVVKIRTVSAPFQYSFTSPKTKLSREIESLAFYSFLDESGSMVYTRNRKEFKYADNVAKLIGKHEHIADIDNRHVICKTFTRDAFISKYGKKKGEKNDR